MYIYKTTNKINGKFYIGLSKFKPEENSDYLGSGWLIKKAINKYGKENFIKEILEECTEKEILLKQERYWISTLQSNNRIIGYNISEGGTWGDSWTNNPRKEALREKFRQLNGGENNPNYGNKWTDEQKKNLSDNKKINKTGFKDPITGLNIAKRLDVRHKLSNNKKGLKNPNSFVWKLISPSGEEFIINGGIKIGIKKYHLDYQQFIDKTDMRVNKAGWKLYKIKKENNEISNNN